MNSLRAIQPYRHAELWVFDDPSVGLVQEPFVSGADRILDHLAEGLPNAERGFTLIFSSTPFPGFTAHFERRHAESGGTWYHWPEQQLDGWLCPALFKYFPEAPQHLYVQARAAPTGATG
jgi:hypothetical protein